MNTEVKKLANRLSEPSDAVTEQRWSEFSMSVPADPARDADLVLATAAGQLLFQAKRIAELESEADLSEKTRDRMANLLTGVANALRGQPPELTSWSWHDLPERAAAAIQAIAVMEGAARDSARVAAELESAANKPARSLRHAIADAIRPYLGPDERVIFRDAFRWKDQDGHVLSNHYEHQDIDYLAQEWNYEIVHDFNHVAVIKDKEPSNG